MKPALLVLLATAFALPMASAPACASDAIVVPAAPYRMFPQDWDIYAGRYVLSNGQTMLLQRRGLRMVVHVSGRPRAQLVAVAQNVFVATDGQLKMTLVDEGDDRITGTVTLMGAGRPGAAAALNVVGR